VVVLASAALLYERARTQGSPAPPEVLSQSFSVERNDPLTAAGRRPADILTLSGAMLLPCESLGLLCYDPASGTYDDLAGFSQGVDFWGAEPPTVQFSVGRGSTGLPGTAVRIETTCLPAEAHGDVFASRLNRLNQQLLDGNGTACSGNSGLPLLIHEGPISDDLDALDIDTCRSVDMNCDSQPVGLTFFTLAPGSPSLAMFGATPADILVSGIDYAPMIWASRTALGLMNGDAIDALCLAENGNGFFDNQDRLLFSLAPDSPSLAAHMRSAADLLRPGARPGVSAAGIGLQSSDDLDAALCSGSLVIRDIYLPMLRK
jgi:hypothetical protein